MSRVDNSEFGIRGFGIWGREDLLEELGGKVVDRWALEKRTTDFALQIVRFVGALPKGKASDVLGYQLLKSATLIGANYREANRAESRADFIHRMAIAGKEVSETQYWLELFRDAPLGEPAVVAALHDEATQLLAIITASLSTMKRRTERLASAR